ncbi:unnamed protein product [Musa acuminata subsp. malaccensis]|uniref:(wild Malaysian banana) hypothetical protein n=1 Tax=Musa acuminata subsp. malaccensis TaxID=214687 RepID=A0A8D7FS02_MUSAM|nr:unnamed protein product [Musa acuminata subsp. malaccensis]
MATGEETREAAEESFEIGGAEDASGSAHGGKAEEGMTPWEQHAAVINLPRYDYAAPSSLLHESRSGFLITCPIKREKSATKEAISLLEEVSLGLAFAFSHIVHETCSTEIPAKKRKLSTGVDPENAESEEKNGVNSVLEASALKDANCLLFKTGEDLKGSNILSLMKLTRSGLLLFTFPNNISCPVVGVVSNIFQFLRSGKLKPPLWCHRIFPIQETCVLEEKDLQLVVSKLMREYLGKDQEKLEQTIKFAVGYNRRGIDETEMKSQKHTNKGSVGSTLLGREACFKVVAGAVKAVAKNSVVDLRSPEVAVLVELLPISGVPLGSLVVGVSVLPLEIVTTKPRLCVKSLVADINVTTRNV